MAVFSVLILTAAPPGQAGEAGGALVKIDGRESLLRSVELFLNRENIKQIQLAFLADELEEAKRRYGSHLSFSGVKVLAGGPRWIDQIMAAGDKIAAECTHVVVHDAARPLVPYSDIDTLLDAAAKHSAVALAAPSRNRLIEVDEGSNPVTVHSPSKFMQLQTPQVFTKDKFREMIARKEELPASDLTILKGSPLNMRLAGPGDATLAKAMMNLLPKPKVRGPSNPFEEASW